MMGTELDWADLTQEQKCVVAMADEESDLSALLVTWNRYRGQPALPAAIDGLGRAVLALVDAGLVVVFRSGEPPTEWRPLAREEVASRIANPGVWHEPRDDVMWIMLSEQGSDALAGADSNELTAIYGG
jgi:hypothetical protein